MTTGHRLRVLDLCAGHGGFSQAFADDGHDVVTLDKEEVFGCTLTMDVRVFAEDPWSYLDEVRPGWTGVDVVLAGPPCEGFAVPSIGKMWELDPDDKRKELEPVPKHPTSRLGVELLDAVVQAVDVLSPRYWAIENPRGMMVRVMEHHHPGIAEFLHHVDYCQYGPIGPVEVMEGPKFVHAQKATRIWTNIPDFDARKCRARPKFGEVEKDGVLWTCDEDGSPCHERAARGWKAGIQRIKGSSHRATMPSEFSRAVLQSIPQEVGA